MLNVFFYLDNLVMKMADQKSKKGKKQ